MTLSQRIVVPEWLDELPAHDPLALVSRKDLRRLNFWMRNARTMALALGQMFPAVPPLRMAELGAGDGTFLLRVARLLGRQWPGVQVTLVDRQPAISAGTRRDIEAAGWPVEIVTADALEWLAGESSLDIVIANLFLHHFDSACLRTLLDLVSQSAKALIACEPCRSGAALTVGYLVGLLGCNVVTRHDAPISVRAGFRAQELSNVWPAPGWKLCEKRAGLFTHVFTARVTE